MTHPSRLVYVNVNVLYPDHLTERNPRIGKIFANLALDLPLIVYNDVYVPPRKDGKR